eukprot:11196651-Lingulodinium_polyedra.AAC.1
MLCARFVLTPRAFSAAVGGSSRFSSALAIEIPTSILSFAIAPHLNASCYMACTPPSGPTQKARCG